MQKDLKFTLQVLFIFAGIISQLITKILRFKCTNLAVSLSGNNNHPAYKFSPE